MNQGENETHWFQKKYPDRVPVLLTIEKKMHKWLVPRKLNISELIMSIRQRLPLKPEQALFLNIRFADRPIMALGNDLLHYLHHLYANDKGMLEIDVLKENTFGSDDRMIPAFLEVLEHPTKEHHTTEPIAKWQIEIQQKWSTKLGMVLSVADALTLERVEIKTRMLELNQRLGIVEYEMKNRADASDSITHAIQSLI